MPQRRNTVASGLLGRVHLCLVILAASLLCAAHIHRGSTPTPTLFSLSRQGESGGGSGETGAASAVSSQVANAADRRILFLRHGQAEHNVRRRYHLPDPPLTPLGRWQAGNVSSTLVSRVDLIAVSPLRRTLQTALLAFSAVIAQGTPLVPHPDLQEAGDLPCDTGSSVDVLAAEFPALNFSLLRVDWNSKKGVFASTKPALRTRGRRIRSWLSMQPQHRIAVVAHGALFRLLLGGVPFRNCEARWFTLRGGELLPG
eukprot:GGOE01045641.1.p1 GENE.GGOE01045641.1~~GGOE01045641.1.p1  ORF type:complete len:270 (-),score=61.08 GGOE01045641.1:230-1000(-)